MKIQMPLEQVKEIIERHDVHPWHIYAFSEWQNIWHVVEPCSWIVRFVPIEGKIYEIGCGCGLNLIWLGQQGFTQLNGSDISNSVIAAGEELATLANVDIRFWMDDGITPIHLPEEKMNAIIALNWISLFENFDMSQFLKIYEKLLLPQGVIAIDVIDESYNKVLNNQYHTVDWYKSGDKRPSEYKNRYSHQQVLEAVASVGNLKIIEMMIKQDIVPRGVYLIGHAN